MYLTQTPLKIFLNPPELLEGFPGDTVELHVVVMNEGSQGALIDVFLDQVFQALSQWCPAAKQRLALDPQQSGEVTFRFEIPIEALPGTYDYTVVVDAPDHYPEDTPIQNACQLKVLRKEQTVIRFSDPTFTLSPPTNPEHPLIVQPGVPLPITVQVSNRSNRVDRFRLACLDLDEDWFSIIYDTKALHHQGLVEAGSGLELNPGSQGQIRFELKLPTNMPAGNYTPTLRLYSANAPELVLLDLVYLQVPMAHQLKVELLTILGKVNRKPGQYQVRLTNQGNLLRELAIGAKGRTEEELCRYTCTPESVRLLIGRSETVDLTVEPKHWWRRPLIGFLRLPFQVELQSLDGLPVPANLPQETLLWQARPWWQFLLLLLAGLSALGGIGFLIWLFFLKPAPLPKLAKFETDSPSYTEGSRVLLNWSIEHPDQISQLILTTAKDQNPGQAKSFDLRSGIPTELSQNCTLQQQLLNCANYNTGATQAGKYDFKLQVQPRYSDQLIEKSLPVEIKPKPLPQITQFEPNQRIFQKRDRLFLKWQVNNFSQLGQLRVSIKNDNGIEMAAPTFTLNGKLPSNLQKSCDPSQNEKLTCNQVPIALPPSPGNYTLQLLPTSTTAQQLQPSEAIKFQVAAIPPKIVSFTLNGQPPNPAIAVPLKAGQTITVSWQVEGDDTTVKLDPIGDVPMIGTQELPVTPTLSRVALTATNKQGQTVEKAFLVQVQLPPSPSPSPTLKPLVPAPTVPLHPR